MAVRLEPQDEYMHELGPEPNFNESMYINVFDPAHGLGGWFRMGNRANEGIAEMTVCLYLPDGRVGFMFKRPAITNNDALDAGVTLIDTAGRVVPRRRRQGEGPVQSAGDAGRARRRAMCRPGLVPGQSVVSASRTSSFRP